MNTMNRVNAMNNDNAFNSGESGKDEKFGYLWRGVILLERISYYEFGQQRPNANFLLFSNVEGGDLLSFETKILILA